MRRGPAVQRACAIVVALLLCAFLSPAARAGQRVTLSASFTPERLGHGTTVGFGFEVAGASGSVPSPLTGLEIRYPGNIGLALSGLGLEECLPARLEAYGPQGCPADSLMGYGSALAEIQVGPETVRENVEIAIAQAPIQNGHVALLFYAKGLRPVDARIVFPGLLLPAPAPFGGLVQINVPLVASLPEAADVAVVRVRATLGPEHLTYYKRVRGKMMAYKPRGIILPDRCPRGGFPFAATFIFQDGTHASASTQVPCPYAKHGSR
jgi:hypothetical protein